MNGEQCYLYLSISTVRVPYGSSSVLYYDRGGSWYDIGLASGSGDLYSVNLQYYSSHVHLWDSSRRKRSSWYWAILRGCNWTNYYPCKPTSYYPFQPAWNIHDCDWRTNIEIDSATSWSYMDEASSNWFSVFEVRSCDSIPMWSHIITVFIETDNVCINKLKYWLLWLKGRYWDWFRRS